ncbi:MAG: hypothetical protein Q8P02_00040, partial [Candidatus Micrarchaeota archaeon]|nr:hypothetical protein [Candidatus Micrarchaeota archaeon]
EVADAPTIMDASFNHPSFQSAIERSALQHNVPFTYVLIDPGKTPQDIQARARRIREAGDRKNSIVNRDLFLGKPPEYWEGDLPRGDKVTATVKNAHDVPFRDFEESMRAIARHLLVPHTAVPIGTRKAVRLFRRIDRLDVPPEEKFRVLLLHLRQHYGFSRNGSASLLALARNPKTGRQDRLNFMHAIDPDGGAGESLVEELRKKPALLDGMNNTANAFVGGRPVHVIHFSGKKSDLRVHARLMGVGAVADAFYIPSGNLAAKPLRRTVGPSFQPHSHAGIFSFYSRERRTTRTYGELIRVLQAGEPILAKWWAQYHNQHDATAAKVRSLVKQVDFLESANTFGDRHSERV